MKTEDNMKRTMASGKTGQEGGEALAEQPESRIHQQWEKREGQVKKYITSY